MKYKLNILAKENKNHSIVILFTKIEELKKYSFSETEFKFISQSIDNKQKLISINQYNRWIFLQLLESDKEEFKQKESTRRAAAKLKTLLNQNKINTIQLIEVHDRKNIILAYSEGLLLSNYQFLKYFGDKIEKENSLESIILISENITDAEIQEQTELIKSVFIGRNLVNEPFSFLNALQLVKEVNALSKESGFELDVLEEKQIQSLKMGGLLAVNQGSVLPARFMILKWQPENAKNKKPVVLVGKGIVFDTGGYSLKPTPDSMDHMKSDMGGAAAVATTLAAVAKNKLPINLIGLIPVTDNAIGNKAYVPSDIITMHNGKTVEVLNTDAEGRLILADALSYASKYEPELVMDLATLTGAAAFAIGHYGIVAMGTADNKVFNNLKKSGNNSYERIVEFPFWDDYDELLESQVADLKNIGGKIAGAITAGKFLEHFTNYPWIHLDIAGPSFVDKEINYLTVGGTSAGTRILYDFLKNYNQ